MRNRDLTEMIKHKFIIETKNGEHFACLNNDFVYSDLSYVFSLNDINPNLTSIHGPGDEIVRIYNDKSFLLFMNKLELNEEDIIFDRDEYDKTHPRLKTFELEVVETYPREYTVKIDAPTLEDALKEFNKKHIEHAYSHLNKKVNYEDGEYRVYHEDKFVHDSESQQFNEMM